MKILGLDLSPNSPGWADESSVGLITCPVKDSMLRLRWHRDNWTSYLNANSPDLVVIEGYAFGMKYNREALAEVGGVVRLAIFDFGIPFVEVPPQTLKKYATGSGKAHKDEVIAAAVKRSGVDIKKNDEADAWWLYQMGAAHYGLPDAVEMPQVNRVALKTPKWPVL